MLLRFNKCIHMFTFHVGNSFHTIWLSHQFHCKVLLVLLQLYNPNCYDLFVFSHAGDVLHLVRRPSKIKFFTIMSANLSNSHTIIHNKLTHPILRIWNQNTTTTNWTEEKRTNNWFYRASWPTSKLCSFWFSWASRLHKIIYKLLHSILRFLST